MIDTQHTPPGIAQLFPASVATHEVFSAHLHGELLPQEAALIARAAAKRRAAFTAGRLCARRALEQLGIRNVPILSGDRGRPLWPDGIVGSITHTDGYCAAAVARRAEARSLGVDAERVDRLREHLLPRVCRPEELAWVRTRPVDERQRAAALLFSAKECFYKCQYALSGVRMGFQEVGITVNEASRTFAVRIDVALPRALWRGDEMIGVYAFKNGYVLTGMMMTRD